MTNDQRAPGLGELLIGEFEFDNPARAADAAENALQPITEGIGAIGDLLWHAGCSESTEISKDTLRHLGCLLKELSDLTGNLIRIQAGATYQVKNDGVTHVVGAEARIQ
jgi:hypothetical protein